MTRNDLDAIQARADAATEGPWVKRTIGYVFATLTTDRAAANGYRGTPIVDVFMWPEHGDANQEFIAHARSDIPALIAEIRELRTWQEAVALGTGYAEEAHGLINIAPAQVIVDGFREATLGGPEEIPRVDNPVQNDPESFAVDNATRVDDPTDDAGYDLSFCGRGPCCLPDGHPGRCQM